jgi:hypothetical protein
MENTNTSGFYKNDEGMLLYGPNYVLGGGFSLFKEQKDFYEYPVWGWKWFNSEEEARLEYNLPKPPEETLPLNFSLPPNLNLPNY